MNISKIAFCKCRRIKLKLAIFLFYHLPTCNKKAEILPLATALIAHLRSQFNYAFALLIPMPCFKSVNFYHNRPKIKLFLQKNYKISERLVFCPQTLLPSAIGGVASKPQRPMPVEPTLT